MALPIDSASRPRLRARPCRAPARGSSPPSARSLSGNLCAQAIVLGRGKPESSAKMADGFDMAVCGAPARLSLGDVCFHEAESEGITFEGSVWRLHCTCGRCTGGCRARLSGAARRGSRRCGFSALVRGPRVWCARLTSRQRHSAARIDAGWSARAWRARRSLQLHPTQTLRRPPNVAVAHGFSGFLPT